MSLSRLQGALRDVYAKLAYPVPWECSNFFVPHPRLERGDFSSSVALSIAARLKVSAPDIAGRFIEELELRVPGVWSEDNGFIVVKGVEGEWWNDEVRTVLGVATLVGELPKNLVVCVVPPGGEIPKYAAVRLLSLAAFQVCISLAHEVTCQLSLMGESPQVVGSTEQLANMFQSGIKRLLAANNSGTTWSESAVATIAAQVQRLEKDTRMCVWMSHHTPKMLSPAFNGVLGEARRGAHCIVRMPNDGWLISRERAIPEILAEPYLVTIAGQLTSPDHWMRFLWHAASSVPSSLFDPAVACFDELASPWYSIQELWSRIKGLLPAEVSFSQCELLQRATFQLGGPPVATNPGRVWSSIRSVPFRVVNGIRMGEVSEAIRAIEEFCELAHRYLNSPNLRRSLSEGSVPALDQKILAGLVLAVSGIVVQKGGLPPVRKDLQE